MCGIAGYVTRRGKRAEVPPDVLVAMTRTLVHRGPDDEGFFRSPGVGLGSRRLSIIDLSPAGHMPMVSDDGSVAVVQNGEIYNFPELRRPLESQGACFRGHSDTEVLLRLYQREGEICIPRLDGMYAIAIWDEKESRLILIRDRFGEKPLYYQLDDEAIVFGSELKALARWPGFRDQLDWEALDEFLTLGYIVAPKTPFRAVRKLPPAHYLVYDARTGRSEVKRYWAAPPPCSAPESIDPREYRERCHAALLKAVDSRLVSDVPIGAFLSGGIDSSLVVAAMSRVQPERVRTVSIGYRFSERHNENPVAEEVARLLGVEHSTLWVEFPEVRELVRRLPEICDEPIGDPAQIGVHLITRFAKQQGLTVMLSGDGGDELFLGYPQYRWVEQLNHVYRLPDIARGAASFGAALAGRVLRNSRLGKAAESLEQPDLVGAAYYLTGYGAWSEAELHRLRPRSAFRVAATRFAEAFGNGAGELSPVARHALAVLATYLPDNNLARMDRAAMANSVETRAPLLAPEVAELGIALPQSMKLRGKTSKYILRSLLSEYLPPSVVNRPKHGFHAFPMDAWLRQELRFLVDEYLNPDRLRRQGVFDPAVVTRTIDQHMRGGRHNHWLKLWLLIVLQMWLERWGGGT